MNSLSDRIKLNNGTGIPCVGYGTWLSPDTEETSAAVAKAIELGYRHIDCAAIYNNETSVGEGIRRSGIKREELFVTSKLRNSYRKYDDCLRSFDDTLEELGLDYVDLYLIHWPAPANIFKDEWRRMNAETWRAFEKLYSDGKVKAIGVSNFRTHHIEALLDVCKVKPAVNQIEYHIGFMQEDIVEYCNKRDIVIEAYKPLGGGEMLAHPTICEVAARYGVSPARLCIKWCMQNGVVPLPKALNAKHLEDNVKVFDFVISPEDMKILNEVPNFTGYGADIDNIQNELSFFVNRRKENK